LALDPTRGIAYLAAGGSAYWQLASVFLAVTGCEALYSNLGIFIAIFHFCCLIA
jgi:K+ transporter